MKTTGRGRLTWKMTATTLHIAGTTQWYNISARRKSYRIELEKEN